MILAAESTNLLQRTIYVNHSDSFAVPKINLKMDGKNQTAVLR